MSLAPTAPSSHRAADASTARRWARFFGPGILVAVGYMDPGNWATSLAGGSRYGYDLLIVILVANVVAMLFQAAAVRLGAGAGVDLAQACRLHFSRRTCLALWLACEIAIVACNLAEVLGMAIGLNLLFGMPLLIGVAMTCLDVMLILSLQRLGCRYLQSVILALVAVIGVSFAFQVMWVNPSASAIAAGFIPRVAIVIDPQMLYLAIGIVGATVMPHNLYLHSALVRIPVSEKSLVARRRAIKFATLDSNVALGIAFFVSAAILVVAAGAFHGGPEPVTELGQAFRLLSPLLGVGVASTLFGIALVGSGLSASVTGTLAGQVVMQGFLEMRSSPALRALVTRSLAIVPAVIVIACVGERGVNSLLILSQVILALQLPFALVPLLLFTTHKKYLGELAFSRPTGMVLWGAAIVIIAMNVWLLRSLVASS